MKNEKGGSKAFLHYFTAASSLQSLLQFKLLANYSIGAVNAGGIATVWQALQINRAGIALSATFLRTGKLTTRYTVNFNAVNIAFFSVRSSRKYPTLNKSSQSDVVLCSAAGVINSRKQKTCTNHSREENFFHVLKVLFVNDGAKQHNRQPVGVSTKFQERIKIVSGK
jgi:hypothetical protein